MTRFSSVAIGAAQPAADLSDFIKARMLEEGYALVETWVSGAKVCEVLKSPAAANRLGVDFYIGLYRSSATSGVHFRLAMQWDGVNKVFRKYAPHAATLNTATPVDVDYTVLDLDGKAPDASLVTPVTITARTSVYYLDVTPDRVMIGMIDGTSAPAYVGIYDSFLPLAADPYPLCGWKLNGSSANSTALGGSAVCEPLQTVSAAYNFSIMSWMADSASRSYMLAPPISALGTNNGYALGNAADIYRGALSGPLWFASARGTVTTPAYRGVLIDVPTTQPSAVRGDTLRVTQRDGSVRSYICVQPPTSSDCLAFVRIS